MTVRALFRVAVVDGAPPPYNTLHLKVFYPAHLSGDDRGQNLGIVSVNVEQAPFPMVILCLTASPGSGPLPRLAAFATPQQQGAIADLQAVFDESDLPFRVALLVWHELPEQFHQTIAVNYAVVQQGLGCNCQTAVPV